MSDESTTVQYGDEVAVKTTNTMGTVNAIYFDEGVKYVDIRVSDRIHYHIRVASCEVLRKLEDIE